MLTAIAALLVSVAMLSACSGEQASRAQFLRYTRAPDGTRLAVVRILDVTPPAETTAQCRLGDLKPGEMVTVTSGSNDWDAPQWMPTQAVVERVK